MPVRDRGYERRLQFLFGLLLTVTLLWAVVRHFLK
jgi:hypothetical protein